MEKLSKNALGYWQVTTKPTEQDLEVYYENKYYQQQKGANQVSYTADEIKFFQAKAMQRGAMVERFLNKDAAQTISLLDVGCGEGFELAHFQSQGWRVKGLDFSRDGMERHNPQCLDVLQTGNIYQLLAQEIAERKCYDVVWMQNVLEHVIEPEKLLRDLTSLVNPGGVVIITVPNDFSALQEYALKHNVISKPFWVALPDHLSYFDAHSLKAVTEANGWKCATIMADFPIDWFLLNSTSNYVEDLSVGKSAHWARIRLENLINQQKIDAVLDFWEALANVGMGRNITAVLQHFTDKTN
ncbi:MAG: class I SAM-dependent methyltransferase [Pseudoalteromonas sp.]